ncbi:MAG: hypothetical protein K2X87_13030 [Gemmataceae bacterium]|nr:hypothetical protein [Gemmataceae bacterium]
MILAAIKVGTILGAAVGTPEDTRTFPFIGVVTAAAPALGIPAGTPVAGEFTTDTRPRGLLWADGGAQYRSPRPRVWVAVGDLTFKGVAAGDSYKASEGARQCYWAWSHAVRLPKGWATDGKLGAARVRVELANWRIGVPDDLDPAAFSERKVVVDFPRGVTLPGGKTAGAWAQLEARIDGWGPIPDPHRR